MKKVTQKMLNDFDRAYSILANISSELKYRGGEDVLSNLNFGIGFTKN